jgi:hypothetical protein
MGTELVLETLYSNELTRLCAREDYIESCRRESFKNYISYKTFEFVKCKTVKLIILSYKLKSTFKIAALVT